MGIAVLLVIPLVVSRLIETDRQMAPLRGVLLKEPAESPKRLRKGAGWCGKGMKVAGIGSDGGDEWTEIEYKAVWPNGQ